MFDRLRHRLLTVVVQHLFAVPDISQLIELPLDNNGRPIASKVFVGHKLVPKDQLEKYASEARLIMNTDLFRLVLASQKESAYKAIYEKSCDEKSLVGPKMWLWCLDVLEKTIKTFSVVDY